MRRVKESISEDFPGTSDKIALAIIITFWIFMIVVAALPDRCFYKLDGDVIEAARRLQVGKTTLYRKLKEWGMGRTADGLPDP